jgi:4-amino-4-deoxy-L-arabinose transferase-like glycosyltransferase
MPILMGLCLCTLVWRFATKMHGRAAGLIALFFAALCPNLLAHSTLATLDLPVAFLIFLTVVLLDRYVEKPTIRRMLALSLALAAATSIKIQALLLVPYTALVLLLSLPRILRSNRAPVIDPSGGSSFPRHASFW